MDVRFMAKKIAIVSILLLLNLFYLDIKSQTVFTADSVAFFEEMRTFLMNDRKDEGKAFMKEFEKVWYGGYFTENLRKGVYDMSNRMLSLKLKPFPDFVNYLNTVASFVKSPYQTEESFENWQKILNRLVEGKGRKAQKLFTDFLTISNDMFTYGDLYYSPAVEWASSDKKFKFDYDSLPVIIFEKTDLICYSKGDSAKIYDTKGKYYPTEGKFYGQGGKITWERAGYKPDELYAKLGNYQILLKTPQFKVDSVMLYFPRYFSKPILGSLEEKVLANVTEEKASYPRFNTYDKRFEIKNIYPDVDFSGGISIQGARLLAKGDEETPARFVFYRDKKPFMLVTSSSFSITPDRLSSMIAQVVLRLDSDSIVHPGLNFKFLVDKNEITLFRDGQGISMAPYYNSYHQIEMDFETMRWKRDEPMIYFTHTTTNSKARFESQNYFNSYMYEQFMGLGENHPMVMIRNLSNKLETRTIHLHDLSNHLRLLDPQTEQLIIQLANRGFVRYNFKEKTFDINDKLFNYVDARSGKTDYDYLQFNSEGVENNGILSLTSYDLTLNGLSPILLSDSQKTVVFPANQTLVLKKNRDFVFGGRLRSGKMDLYGKEFYFNYKDFKVDLKNVDSLILWAWTGNFDRQGRQEYIPVRTTIEKIHGELMIDHPMNKSGRKSVPRYPIITTDQESYVFYDQKSKYKGVYKRENFYFKIYPFTMDSIDIMPNEAIKFDGIFASAGIFPDIEETLRLQPDYSLGFEHKIPDGGYPVYAGKGEFYNKIMLSNEGLRGDGKLEYLTSTTLSNQFNFFPDSMNTMALSYEIKPQKEPVEYPSAKGENVLVQWYPKKEDMKITALQQPLAMYDNKSYMKGYLDLTPQKLTGSGLYSFEKAELESKNILFKYEEFLSDTADFRLKDDISSSLLAFKTTNVNAYVTFKERYGHFKSNGGGSFIEFPQNQYICYMEEFKWYMDNDDIELSSSKQSADDATGVKLEGSQFISIHPDQDSLSFFAPKARYDLKKHIIYADGVRFFQVADVMIYPDSGKVVIEKNAKMRMLENAKIVASYITQYHKIYKANVNIYGKRKFSGSGYIDYVDELNIKTPIYLENIGVDTTGMTYATGSVPKEENFTLSPQFAFHGRVMLKSNQEFLTFKGYSKIKHECDKLPIHWFEFTASIDPSNILIPVDSIVVGEEGNDLGIGIFYNKDTLGNYPAFISPVYSRKDQAIIAAGGFLMFDKESKEYRVANKLKLNEMSFPGNYVALKTEHCKLYSEGKINLGADLGKVELITAGNIIYNTVDKTMVSEMMMIINFYIEEKAMEDMAKRINEKTSLDPVDYTRPVYEKALRELLPKNEADNLIAQINLNGMFKKVPSELNKTLVLTDVKMKWDDVTQSYVSIGKIGIGNIYKDQINKMVDGKIQIKKKKSGDVISIYLELDQNNWYFFTYTRGLMQVYSSSETFNSIIMEVKPDKRKLSAEKGQMPYQYMLSNKRKLNDFLKGIEE